MKRYRVTLTVCFDMDLDAPPDASAMAVAHTRAEAFGARVFVCGDTRGRLELKDGPTPDGVDPVEKICERVDTAPGSFGFAELRPKRDRRPRVHGPARAQPGAIVGERKGVSTSLVAAIIQRRASRAPVAALAIIGWPVAMTDEERRAGGIILDMGVPRPLTAAGLRAGWKGTT